MSKPDYLDFQNRTRPRKLRAAGLLRRDVKPWSRHGSTPYLWTEEEVERAIDYVVNGQEDKPFRDVEAQETMIVALPYGRATDTETNSIQPNAGI